MSSRANLPRLPDHLLEVFPVIAFRQGLHQLRQAIRRDIAHPIGDFLDTGNLLALPMFDRADEFCRLCQRVHGPCV